LLASQASYGEPQRYEQITPRHEERVPDDGKGTCSPFDQHGERGLKLVLGAGFHHQQFSPERLHGGPASLVSISASGLVGFASIPIVEALGTN
jgi:hypothetical protein